MGLVGLFFFTNYFIVVKVKWYFMIQFIILELLLLCHGGESRDLNDGVHGISCGYSDRTNYQNLSHFS